MNLYEAAYLARDLMREHGLIGPVPDACGAAGWTFAFDHARRRFGRCDYTDKRITLSRPLTLLNGIDEVRDTLLHEIAHALCPGDGHGPRWRAACRRIGARPRRCYDDKAVVSPKLAPPRYLFGCPACDWWVQRRRASRRRYHCKACRGRAVFRERGTEVLPG